MTLQEMEELDFKVELDISTLDGNAFHIIAAAKKAARQAHLTREGQEELAEEMMSGSFDELLRTCYKYFDVY